MLIALAIPIPTRSPHSSIIRRASASPSCAASHSLHAGQLAACREPATERRRGVLARVVGDQPVERVARGLALQRAALRELARLGHRAGHVHGDHRMPKLARAAGRAPVDPPAEHQAAADAGADRQHHEVAGDHPQIVVVGLGQRRDGRIVIDEDGHAEPLAEPLAQRHVAQRDIGRGDDPPGLELDDRRHPDPDPVQLRPAAGSTPATSCSISASEPEVSVATIVDSASSWPSKHANAIFVPPRSTPTTSVIARVRRGAVAEPRGGGLVDEQRHVGGGGRDHRRRHRRDPARRRARTPARARRPSTLPAARNTACEASATALSVNETRGTNGSRPASGTPTTRRERSWIAGLPGNSDSV